MRTIKVKDLKKGQYFKTSKSQRIWRLAKEIINFKDRAGYDSILDDVEPFFVVELQNRGSIAVSENDNVFIKDEPLELHKGEKQVFQFALPLLSMEIINKILCDGYMETGNKFSVMFGGSKGYMSYIEILCEGQECNENRIWVERLLNKNGTLSNKDVHILHSYEKGVRVVIA